MTELLLFDFSQKLAITIKFGLFDFTLFLEVTVFLYFSILLHISLIPKFDTLPNLTNFAALDHSRLKALKNSRMILNSGKYETVPYVRQVHFSSLVNGSPLWHLQKLQVDGFSSHFSFKFISASSPSVSVTTKQKYVADSKSGICGGTFIQFLRGTFTYPCRFFFFNPCLLTLTVQWCGLLHSWLLWSCSMLEWILSTFVVLHCMKQHQVIPLIINAILPNQAQQQQE